MRHRIALIFAGIAAVAAGSWYLLRTRDPAPGLPAEGPARVSGDRSPDVGGRSPAGVTPRTGGAAPVRDVPSPRLGAAPRGAATASPATSSTSSTSDDVHAAFDAEPRDAAWAPDTEREVLDRATAAVTAAGLGARLGGVECRAQRCRITVDGADEDAVGRTIARLEDTAGLDGLADALVLGAPEPLPDGGLRLRVYAVFERAAAGAPEPK